MEDAIADLKPEVISKIKSNTYLKNKNLLVILINDTNCYPCKSALVLIDSMYSSINKKITPVVIITAAPKENFEFLKTEQKHFPEFYESSSLLNESQLNTFPTFFILNKQLKTVYKSEGFNNRLKSRLTNEIDRLSK